jgi:hypothetical protein
MKMMRELFEAVSNDGAIDDRGTDSNGSTPNLDGYFTGKRAEELSGGWTITYERLPYARKKIDQVKALTGSGAVGIYPLVDNYGSLKGKLQQGVHIVAKKGSPDLSGDAKRYLEAELSKIMDAQMKYEGIRGDLRGVKDVHAFVGVQNKQRTSL